VTDVERAQPRAMAGGEEVAPLEPRELLAAQPAIAERQHDRHVARAGQRIVRESRLGLAQQPLVLLAAQRLGRLTFAALGARQPDRQRLADLAGGNVLVRGQPAQEAVERGAVLLDCRARTPAGDQVRVVAGNVGRRQVREPGQRPQPVHEARARAPVGALRLRARDQRVGEALDQLGRWRDQLAAHRRRHRRRRFVHHQLEDLRHVELPRDRRVRLAHRSPPSSRASWSAGGRSPRPGRAWVQWSITSRAVACRHETRRSNGSSAGRPAGWRPARGRRRHGRACRP
jgi:hypothetical protein